MEEIRKLGEEFEVEGYEAAYCGTVADQCAHDCIWDNVFYTSNN